VTSAASHGWHRAFMNAPVGIVPGRGVPLDSPGARGEIRSDITIDVVIQAIGGSFFARHLVGQADDDAWLDAVFDTLWRGIAAGG
jgi:hypothetical protein